MEHRRRVSKSASYLLRMTPEEKAALEDMAMRSGTTLAEAMRQGAHDYLRRRVMKPVSTTRDRGHAATG